MLQMHPQFQDVTQDQMKAEMWLMQPLFCRNICSLLCVALYAAFAWWSSFCLSKKEACNITKFRDLMFMWHVPREDQLTFKIRRCLNNVVHILQAMPRLYTYLHWKRYWIIQFTFEMKSYHDLYAILVLQNSLLPVMSSSLCCIWWLNFFQKER